MLLSGLSLNIVDMSEQSRSKSLKPLHHCHVWDLTKCDPSDAKKRIFHRHLSGGGLCVVALSDFLAVKKVELFNSER